MIESVSFREDHFFVKKNEPVSASRMNARKTGDYFITFH